LILRLLSSRIRIRFLLLAALFIGTFAVPARAQGCAACKDAVKNSPAQTQRAFRRGIFMLLIPAAGAILAFGVMIRRNQNSAE
jgi:hypothetical protein